MCVLLVEDEVLIREVMAESLQDAGFDVVEAANGHQALAALQQSECKICIVVTDYHMPGGIDGSEVALQARAAMPGIPVIIASGRPDVMKASWQVEHGFRLIRKPYLPSQLVATVEAMVHPSR